MSDIGINQTWLVSPNAEIEKKWKLVAIQERLSRIARYKQDIEDLVKGKIVDLEARIMMLEKEVKELERQMGEPVDVDTEAYNG
jgi:hypothetical protein